MDGDIVRDIPSEQTSDEIFEASTIADKGKTQTCENAPLIDGDGSSDSEYMPQSDSSSTFDSDEIFLANDVEIDSDVASAAFEDVEGSSDEDLAKNYCAQWCGRDEYEITLNLDKYVVDLDRKTCTCGMFQLSGIPCCHGIAAIGHKRAYVVDYIDDVYKKPTYMKVYEHMIHGVPGQKYYITTGIEPLKPPNFKTKIGRPKKLRNKGPGESDGKNLREKVSSINVQDASKKDTI